MTILDTDPWPREAPNPPPWQVHYDSDEEGTTRREVLPVAYTIGLLAIGLNSKRDIPELRIHKAPPQIASVVLDRIGVWLVYENGVIEPGHVFKVAGVRYTAVLEVDTTLKIYRLAWHKDPSLQKSETSQLSDKR